MDKTAAELLDLRDRHCLVTGAASGIGRATATLFAALGAKLSLVDRDELALDAALARLAPGSHAAYPYDLENIDGIDDLVRRVVAGNGPLHAMMHAAGTQSVMAAKDLKPERWRRILAVNTEAALALSRNMGRLRVHPGGGAIIFVSSIMAMAGSPGSVAYSMSKSALHGLTRSLALEFAPRQVRVNCIAPGFVRTPMLDHLQRNWPASKLAEVESLHPLGFGEPEDIANAAAFLAAPTGRWITGTVLVVDGGYLAR